MTLIAKIRKHPEEVALGIILFIGAVFRFRHLGFTSLSNDELSALTRTRFSGFAELIDKGVAIDGHPAFVQVLLYYWIKIFGDGVFSVRFPFAVAGILAILFVYLLGKNWYSKQTGLFAAAAMSTLQFPLLYSQIARPYAFSMLFTLMAAYFWSLLLFGNSTGKLRKNRKYLAAAYVLSMSACMYTHYFSFMLATIIGITGLFFIKKENWKEYIVSGIIIILLFVPYLPVFFRQLDIGGIGFWLIKPDESFFRLFINYCFNDSNLIYYLCFGICVTSFVFFRKRIAITKFHWLSLGWFLLPFFIGYYYSVLINPVLQFSTLLLSFPFLLMFLFSFIPAGALKNKIALPALAVFTMVCGYQTVKGNHYYWTNHFGVFKELASDAIHWSDKYGDDNILKVISVSNPRYIDYYFEKMGRKMKIDLYKADEESELARLMAMVDTSSAAYLLYGWSNIRNPDEAVQIIMHKFPTILERDTFFNSEISLFKRDIIIPVQNTITPATDFENTRWGDELKLRSDELAHSGKYSQKMDDKTEYSINYVKRLIDIIPHEKGMVTASVWINSKDADNDARLVISFESGGKSIEWHPAAVKSFNLKPGEWQKVIISRPLPKLKANDDVMKVYVWNPGKKVFYVDDFEVKVEKRKR